MKYIKYIMIGEETQDAIDNIMDNFDFEKVHRVMEYLDWKWAGIDGYGVPNIYELRKRARMLIKEAVKDLERDKECNISTGGFCVSAWRAPEDDKVFIKLSFVITDWDSYE